MRRIGLIAALVAFACSNSTAPADIAPPDASADVVADAQRTPDAAPPSCGDGTCSGDENCLFCSVDCDCSCGDGICTFGEWCAICPSDCDCETLAATPPMGWNSWNLFDCDIDEELAREMADALLETGMAELGYRYVNLDDCWQVERDDDGVIVADPDRFPSGISALAETIHAKGLKFGLYTCAGTHTCEERPGSYGFEELDMQTYADWQVDFVKVDWCFTDGLVAVERYQAFRDAIDKTGHEIMLSICNWGFQDALVWAPAIGELWRTSGDIKDNVLGLMYNLLEVEDTAAYARVGHWNDPDMMEVGNGGMTVEEYQSHFGLWCLFAAPLIAGNDIRQMEPDIHAILTNQEAIAVDQDPSGLQGVLLHEDGPVKVFGRPLTLDGARAVVLFNANKDDVATGKVSWQELGLADQPADVRDLWSHEDLGLFPDGFQADLEPFHSRFLLITGHEPTPPSGDSELSNWPWKHAANARGAIRRNTNADGGPLTLGGKARSTGVGAFGAARLVVHLGGACTRFSALVGIDDLAPPSGSATFEVLADGESLFATSTMRPGDEPVAVDVPLDGRRELHLVVTPAGDQTAGDLADWGEAVLTCR